MRTSASIWPSDLPQSPFLVDSSDLYASSDYIKRFGVPSSVDDLKQHRLVGYDTNDQILRGFARNGVAIGK